MPVLKNAKHERFAQQVAKGVDIGKAYAKSGYKASKHAAEVSGSRLLKKAEIQARIEELKSATAEQAVRDSSITKAEIMRMLRDNYRLAMKEKEIAPANRAAELLGKEIGMFVERKRIGPLDIADLTDEELEQLAIQFEAVRLSRTSPARDPLDPAAAPGDARPRGDRTH